MNIQLIDCTRVSMVGKICEDTPEQVILEVAESMGYRVDYTIDDDLYIECFIGVINRYHDLEKLPKTIEIDKKKYTPLISDVNLSNSAKLINSDSHEWNIEKLNEAFVHLVSFTGEESQISPGFKAGKKTPEEPLNYDVTMLYMICRKNKLKTYRHSNLANLENLVRLLIMSKSELISMINSLKEESCRDSEADLDSLLNEFFHSDIKSVFSKKYIPLSNEEAISFTLYKYGINILFSENPMEEYKYISSLEDNSKECQNIINKYTPKDPLLLKMFNRDKTWISHDRWIPDILNSYSRGALVKIAEREGFTGNDLIDPKESLVSLKDYYHVYVGIHPSFPIYSDIDTFYSFDLKNSEDVEDFDLLFTIGKTSDINSLYLMTVNELIAHFNASGNFSLPNNKNYYFNSVTINKLKNLCIEEMCKLTDKNISLLGKPVTFLKDLINNIEIMDNNLNRHIDKIKKLPEKDRNEIKKYLIQIMELAYYLRGWKVNGNDEPPLSSCQTLTSEDFFDEIEGNFHKQYKLINNFYRDLKHELTDIIDEIYLVSVGKKGDEFVFSGVSNPDVGKTLMDKILIIMDNQDDNACIRVSSNYILYTVYHYCRECFDETLFDINKLSNIS